MIVHQKGDGSVAMEMIAMGYDLHNQSPSDHRARGLHNEKVLETLN